MSPDRLRARPTRAVGASRPAHWRATAPSDRSADWTASGLHCAAAAPRPAAASPAVRLRVAQCRNAASRFSSVRVPVLPWQAQRQHAVRRCGPASAAVHILRARALPECGLRLEPVPGVGAPPPPTGQRPQGRPSASGTALCSAWREGRPDEGLCSAAALVAFERAAAHHASHHDPGRHQRERPGGEAGHSRQGPDRPSAGAWRVRHRQPDARCRSGDRYGASLRRRDRVITFEEQLAKDKVAAEARAKRGERRLCRVRRW